MDSFDKLANILYNFDTWWMISFALALIILDWAFIQTDAFMIIGFSILIMSIFNAIGLYPRLQLWLCPVSLIFAFIYQRKLFNYLTSNKSPYTLHEKSYIGAKGIFQLKESTNESQAYFFGYKDSMHVEDSKEINKVQRITKIILNDTGEVFPVSDDDILLKNGERVEVVGEVNGLFFIKKEAN
jgi:membrane protein implicated in regulation of membrane protease activity